MQSVAVIRAGGRDGIGDGQRALEAWLVHRIGLPFDVHGIAPGIAADLFGDIAQVVGQQVANPLAMGDLVHHLDDGVAVAKAQLEAVGILQGKQAVLKAFHGQGDAHARADGI